MEEPKNQLIDEALAYLPVGCYMLTAAHDSVRSGMLVHSVQRVCDEPHLICVAARKGHKIDPLIRDSRSFAIGFVEPEDKLVAKRFRFTDAAPSEFVVDRENDPFDALPTRVLETGSPILDRCPIWFDCEVMRRVDLESEMELFVGVIVAIWYKGQQLTVPRKPEPGASQ